MPSPRLPENGPGMSTVRDLAGRIAELTRRIHREITPLLAGLQTHLVPRLPQGAPHNARDAKTRRQQVAETMAQTLAYSLFAAGWYQRDGQRSTLNGARDDLLGADPQVRQLLEFPLDNMPVKGPFRRAAEDLLRLGADCARDACPGETDGRHPPADPPVTAYEDFLRVYDPRTRSARGVYFTPEPVVAYLVRSVDHLLRTRFGCAAGLSEGSAAIFDPACGTGAFLSGVVDHVRANFINQENPDNWPEFAGRQLLPRLIGFDLLPGALMVAHLKLTRQLFGPGSRAGAAREPEFTHADFGRPHLYLANALDGAGRNRHPGWKALGRAEEASTVLVVLGNPPYSGISSNRGTWIDRLLRGTQPGEQLSPGYYEVDGQPLKEKKLWLQDDYVKFVRFGQWRIERAGAGILALVTNHAYLDNPTFRGMRQSLTQTFNDIYVLDLHGNAKKKETCPDGSPDENVFDIQQGVSIGLFVKEQTGRSEGRIHHAELWGSRQAKFKRLSQEHVGTTRFERVGPAAPFHFFVGRNETLRAEYEQGWKITDIMPAHSTGIVTARDHFVIDLDERALLDRIAEFQRPDISDAEIRRTYFAGKGSLKYPPGDTRGWKLDRAREAVRDDDRWRQRVVHCLYRPFDVRPMYYTPWMVDWPRTVLMRHMLAGDNLALITVRQVAEGRFNHVFVSDAMVDGRATLSNRGIAYVFPLYLCCSADEDRSRSSLSAARGTGEHSLSRSGARRANLNSAFVADLAERLRLRFLPDGAGDLKTTFGPQDVLHYIYALLIAPSYRDRFTECLRSDFPRVRVPGNPESFGELVRAGRELVLLHLLEHPVLDRPDVRFPGEGSNLIAAGFPRYAGPGEPDPFDPQHRRHRRGRVYINKDGGCTPRDAGLSAIGEPRGQKLAAHKTTSQNPQPKAQFFEGVKPETWGFELCGYQPVRKYLADRRRRALSLEEITRYGQLASAADHTLRLTCSLTEVGQAV